MNDNSPYWEMLDDDALIWDGCDDAIIGVARRCSEKGLLVYDYELLLSHFINDGMTEEEAAEWIDYNIASAWIGEQTPLLLFRAPQ